MRYFLEPLVMIGGLAAVFVVAFLCDKFREKFGKKDEE